MQIDRGSVGSAEDRESASGLAAALTREHHDIDGGIEAFVSDLSRGVLRVDPLLTAMLALRRHIYLEEEFVFPPIRAAGMTMPIMVMLREHGLIWRAMDAIDALVTAQPTDGADVAAVDKDVEKVLTGCRELLALLDRHNSKEEPIIYPRAESDLTGPESRRLAEFLRTGRMPDGWICQDAADPAPMRIPTERSGGTS